VQAEFLNVFNHPTFGWGNNSGFNGRNSVLGSNFGTGTELGSFSAASGAGPRRIELRANIEF
jgi:hypothetical protein